MKEHHDAEQTEMEKGMTARQQRLLTELVRNPNIQAAAKAAGVGRTSVYRWLAQPDFADELNRRRNEAMNEALSSVKSLTARAAQELVRLLDTQDERLLRHICNDILGHALKVRETEQIEQRLTQLEKQLNHPWKIR